MSVNGRFVRACAEGDIQVFNSLLSLADLNTTETGTSPLIAAVMGNHMDIVNRLLKHPAINVNKTDKESWSALHHACFQNRTQAVEAIINTRGVNMNLAEQVTGKTPLMVAVMGESYDVLASLVATAGIGLLLTDNDGHDVEDLAR